MSSRFSPYLLPYFLGRVARKFLPFGELPKLIRQKIPGFQANLGEQSPQSVFAIYEKATPVDLGSWVDGKTVLEIGTGRTNGSCYMFAAKGATFSISLEPFRSLDVQQDALQLEDTAKLAHRAESSIAERVKRTESFAQIPDESCDAVFSLAVLEHVQTMGQLVDELWRVLKPGGWMIHVVDYRDHFFKYPYHHLLWSRKTWDLFLDPGDLPRWRVGDHVKFFEEKGFVTTVLKATAIDREFAKIRSKIHPEFTLRYSLEDLKTAFATLWVEKPSAG